MKVSVAAIFSLLLITTIPLGSESKSSSRECNALSSFQPGPYGEINRNEVTGNMGGKDSRRCSGVSLNWFHPRTRPPFSHDLRPACFYISSIWLSLLVSKKVAHKVWGMLSPERLRSSVWRPSKPFCQLHPGMWAQPSSRVSPTPAALPRFGVGVGKGVLPRPPFFSLFLRMN